MAASPARAARGATEVTETRGPDAFQLLRVVSKNTFFAVLASAVLVKDAHLGLSILGCQNLATWFVVLFLSGLGEGVFFDEGLLVISPVGAGLSEMIPRIPPRSGRTGRCSGGLLD